MIVTFLDFDGVLNSESSFTYRRLLNDDPKFYVSAPNPMSVALLDYFLFVTGSKVVISSSWRSGDINKDKQVLQEEFGLVRVNRVIGFTPHINGPRGNEIQHWLDRNPVDNYVIFDDDRDMLTKQKRNFVNTQFKHGFTVSDFHKALRILGKEKEEEEVHRNEDLIALFRKGKDYYKDET